MERRLPLWEMTPGVDLEGLQMSSDPLPVDDLHRRVAGMVGKLDAGAFSQLLMHPDRGRVSLVSVCSFFLLVSDCPWFSQPRLPGGRGSQAFPATGPGGRGGPSCTEGRRGEEEREEGREEGSGPRADAGSGRLERLHRRQERDGLPREPSPETPDDDDDDEDDEEDDDMAARLDLSPDLRLGQGSSSQPPSGLAPSVSGAGTSGSRSEERGQAEGVLDPLAEVVEVTLGS
jgi:hypothetical protein